ncbi:DUF2380 domain-containing protein [Archangium violaceum]|uniref:DUF2380 domain-containing protein n=1 Tax=Archangium violaceum TaxID=83451 RepID=UPI00195057B8|nr:DUF2380 domain-containing protein [Archangium violaceum]QRN93815.1 DUF2380 domain-containing protein [Archangium violaceum]
MRTDSSRARWAGLLLAMVLLSTGCTSLTPPPGQRVNLRYMPREIAEPTLAKRPTVMAAGSDNAAGTEWQNALAAHLAFRGAVGDVSGSTRRLSGELSRLKTSNPGIAGGGGGIFLRYVEHGERQLRWIEAELVAATRLANAASEVDDLDMQLALLRLAGPRLEAAMLGSLLLAGWLDFLNLVDVVLKQGFNRVETLFANMDRLQKMLEPSMTALSSLDPGQMEAAAKDLPSLMGQLSGEFNSTCETVRVAMKRGEQVMLLAQLVETVAMVSTLKMPLPRLPPSAPATLGVSLMVGSNGVMTGTRMVVSAEWVEMMRRLVRASVISLPVVSATVRIQAGQVMMAQSHDELPRGVRDALGDGPEVQGMRVTNRAGAGMTEPPRHHVLPREFREWFEQRGFTGEMSIDQFCVRMEQAKHEAIHGGGNWRLGRTWPGEWNRMLMKTLRDAEVDAGRMLTRNEILRLVAKNMRDYRIPVNFTPWMGR